MMNRIFSLSGSQADTYIESRFEEACMKLANGDKVLNEWRKRKEQYTSYTNLIIFDFQHYSIHDMSHSVKILEAVELMLGRERVDFLGAGDLWLLLETAYFHDIGMAVTYDDLIEIWESDDFKKFLESTAVQSDPDLRNARNLYVQMDNLVHDRDKMYRIENENEILLDDTWPVELERKLVFLVTAYIRKDHARRCEKYLNRFGEEDTAVQKRLYQIAAQISVAHGEAFSYIFEKLKQKSQGLGMDYVHPQFVAALIRLGDLLDMDNNRFNLRVLEHYGDIPWSSLVHLKKHKAMTHIVICPERIEAEAEDENMEVCQVTRNWFQYIEQEVTDLICYWSEIAPHKLKGCMMRKAKCVVYCPHAPSVFQADWQKRFEVDKAKLTDLMIGVNIYDTKLDFLREYIQNALDASKMQLWLDLKHGKYPQYQCNPNIPDISQLTPFDIPQALYDQYMIEVQVELDITSQQVLLKIIDYGIGMEEACLDVISRIGLGWRGRKAYSDEIPQMLPWLRPTGGFGIGIQSAFMLTDQIELLTRSDKELKTHKVIMNSPRTSGLIIEETAPAAGLRERGTTVKLKINLDYFQSWNEECRHSGNLKNNDENNGQEETVQNLLGSLAYEGADIFSEDNTLDYVIKLIEQYLKTLVVNSFIPIRITNSRREEIILRSEYGITDSYWNNSRCYVSNVEELNGQNYRWIYNISDESLRIWAEKEAIYTYIKKEKVSSHITCFKNVCVVRNTNFNIPAAAEFTICMDYLGQTAESALKVHRNAFNENFSHQKYIMNGIYIYIRAMIYLMAFFKNINNKMIYETIYNNLYNSNISLIRLLYYGESSDLQWEKQVDVIQFKSNEIENTEQISLNEIHQYENAKFLLDNIKSILITDSSDVIYIRYPYSVKTEWPIINEKIFQALRQDIQENKETVGFQLQENVIKEIEKESGLRLIDDREIYDIIVSSNRFEVKYLRVSVTDYDFCIAVFSKMLKSQSETGDKAQENEEFYKAAYSGNERRQIWGTPDASRYEKLMVSRLPYGFQMVNSGPFLISPINAEIRLKYPKTSESDNGIRYRKIYPYDKFISTVMDDKEFQAVLEWVYENQVEEKKYSKEELKNEYQRFISDIYVNYLLGIENDKGYI